MIFTPNIFRSWALSTVGESEVLGGTRAQGSEAALSGASDIVLGKSLLF